MTRPPSHWTEADLAYYELVHGFKRGNKTGCAAAAAVLGKAPGTVCNEANPEIHTHKPDLNGIIALELAAGEFPVLYAHAHECHHACYPLPDPDENVSDVELLKALTEWNAAIGRTMQQINATFEDNKVEPHEVRAVVQRLHTQMRRGLEFVERLRMIQEPEADA